ncbi:MAG TPA: hypothetical protein VKZ55_07855 [Microthrixaceae bacterium]|nr:hypothetical protein [Microthrixaceae bacterium]
MTEPKVRCASCDPAGRGRYCARLRCYCGHPDCWAADSWQELPPPVISTPDDKAATRAAQAWKEREETTWIDR